MTGLCLLGALWIGGLVPPPPEKDYAAFFADAPHAVLTKTLTVPAVSNASWRIVTPAMCDAFVNGTRITATTLVPWTDFKFRVMEDVYDVTSLLKAGENELRLELGNGWWNPLPMKMWYVESLRDKDRTHYILKHTILIQIGEQPFQLLKYSCRDIHIMDMISARCSLLSARVAVIIDLIGRKASGKYGCGIDS